MSVNGSDYSDSDDESNSSTNSELEITPKKNVGVSINIESDVDDDDSVADDSEGSIPDEIDNDESDIENIQTGGIDSELEEGEIDENEGEDEEEGEGDKDDDNDSVADDVDETLKIKTPTKQLKIQKGKKKQVIIPEDDIEDEYDDSYLQKFDSEITKNYITEFHPECLNHNYEEITRLCTVIRNSNNIIIDPLHKTIPFLTKYEKARILGQRAKQIETGAKPFIKIDENIVDSYVIAELELKEKKIPFIIKRPIPNGGFEYWNIKDLEFIGF